MRHAVILAGGSGTRLWPLSRGAEPKQLIPILGGKSLLELAFERLEGLVPAGRRYVCAGERHREAVARRLPALPSGAYFGEPVGRDTLAALAFSAAVVARGDPEAVLGVFPADHLICPEERFRAIVSSGYVRAEERPEAVVTFGIAPTRPATSFGYLELAEETGGGGRRVSRFREKPELAAAESFLAAGAERYLWNSGIFIFRAATFLERLAAYEPETERGARRIAAAWGGPEAEAVLRSTYPALRKVSFDFGMMEPASVDPAVRVEAFPMSLEWLDIGSWPAYASVYAPDGAGNTSAAARSIIEACSGTLLVSDDPDHLVAALGCEDLIVVHTARATLVCRKDRAEEIKRLQALVAERFGAGYV